MQTHRVEPKGGRIGKKLRAAAVIIASISIALLALGGTAAASAPSEADQTCLACHSAKVLSKKLQNGDKLDLHVAGPAFAASVHGVMGCAGCHADIDLKSHPPSRRKIAGAREYSVARTEVCGQCHEDQFKQYEGSIHASLLREGNPVAPVCTDCHSPHAVRPKSDRTSIGEVPCRQCHDEVFNAYAGSVHGLARSKPGNTGAPICADCHHAHDVKAAATGDRLKTACLGCHQNVLSVHQAWLPNTERHLQAISCPACHVPAAQRRVDLRLYDSATQERTAEKVGVPQFESRAKSADAKGLGLDALALQSLLREFNQAGGDSKTVLRGRLELRNGIEAHQLVAKSLAIKSCDSCHRQGAAPFQSVTVSIVGPDGRPLRYGAQNEVLNSVTSVESIGGFYAIGGTRIKILDVLFLLALLSGIAVPAGHMILKWLFRKYRATRAGAPGAPAAGGGDDHAASGESSRQKE